MIKTDKGTKIYIDPYHRRVDPHEGLDWYSEKADIILLSHNHPDHFSPAIYEKIRVENTKMITSDQFSRGLWEPTIIDFDEDVDIKVNKEEVKLRAVYAYNNRTEGHTLILSHEKGFAMGFLILVEDKIIYYVGDSDLIREMNDIGEDCPKGVDLLLVPVDDSYTMGPRDAAELCQIVKAKVAIPMHWGTVSGDIAQAEEFKERAEAHKTKVKILKNGEKYNL